MITMQQTDTECSNTQKVSLLLLGNNNTQVYIEGKGLPTTTLEGGGEAY